MVKREKVAPRSKGEEGVTMEALHFNADGKIVGVRELRKDLSKILDSVINSNQFIITGNKFKVMKTATIIPTILMEEILSNYKFNPTIDYDETTKQHYVKIPEIDVEGVGDTEEAAIHMAVDNAGMIAENFFEEADTYMRFGKYRKMYPYYMRVLYAENTEALIEVLNLNR